MKQVSKERKEEIKYPHSIGHTWEILAMEKRFHRAGISP
jgi:hypothetical protein